MAIDKNWHGKEYAFFSHKKCEAFPCHKTEDEDDFNCLFCYCPLYFLSDCGGMFTYLPDGVKDCSSCALPHERNNYGYIIDHFREITKKMEADRNIIAKQL